MDAPIARRHSAGSVMSRRHRASSVVYFGSGAMYFAKFSVKSSRFDSSIMRNLLVK